MKNKNLIVKIAAFLLAACCLITVVPGCGGAEDVPDESYEETPDDVPANADPDTQPSETKPAETKKRVALTFDDGPHNVRTREIVDELDKYGFTATFFVVGNRVDGEAYRGGETVKYVIDHGHEVGVHGYTHEVYYDECTDAELKFEMEETVKAIKEYAKGYNPTLMRPVGGYITSERVQTSNYAVIMWSVDSFDYKYAYFADDERYTDEEKEERVNTIVDNVMSNVHDGAIILMHDLYLSTSDAVKIILQRLDAEGYEVVSVSELLGNPAAGEKYSSLKK